MKTIVTAHHPVRHLNSFKYALRGISHAFLNEANFRVQLVITIFSGALGFYFKISSIEWAFLVLSLGSLLSSEIINTVIEEFIDHLIHEHHEGARIIKDLSAGFVLTTSITTLFILILVFGERLLSFLFR
ncbi:MAG TPA: diacylglycerol kinase [Candidatus Saccharimonadales bacterium]|nr:diacylglycerol kinase [Candidatus Saccharimonadales bacterium]